MNVLIKKFIIAFAISLLIFSMTAAVISIAVSMEDQKSHGLHDQPQEKDVLEGESFNLLLIMSDYVPEKFNDYDPDAVRKIFGTETSSEYISNGLLSYRKIHAESMTLLRFDKERREITFTHIPGNTFVSVKGVKMCLKDIPAQYGTQFLIDKVHALLGIEIDSYVLFTPKSAATALDLFGEITYTVQCDMKQRDAERGVDINIRSGSQKLNGATAVDMLRFNAYTVIGTSKSVTARGYLKRFVNKVVYDFTYEEIRDIINSALTQENIISNFSLEKSEGAIGLLMCSDELSVVDISLIGKEQTVDEEKYFLIDEIETLEAFKPYRKINTPENIWG